MYLMLFFRLCIQSTDGAYFFQFWWNSLGTIECLLIDSDSLQTYWIFVTDKFRPLPFFLSCKREMCYMCIAASEMFFD
jgi:hypothetical protein